ncbi:excinuclease ABC subunit UvrA [Methylacidimicrobium sp. B4]|uniref:excinuclease ABC subunit UvrA n=1 Tax=Methylacidimicrobium sp. B4 TaxID=2796139 RepID=UPI001A90BDB2|nr:excinuclease ABC subunit UvrA [Methylacidimicrobium sp. B4]QSR83928.1 excinuclease ABC subunit UvrA [Methylacidimicrobium sp. B4]
MRSPASCSQAFISLRGVRVHNLRSIDLEIPRGKLTVITGPSGSGKSSLAFDTLYAEGQRRYVETFSPYVRQFLERMEKPDCEAIEGILPAIAVGQSGAAATSRSTLGTMSGTLDYLKSVYARAATLVCPHCRLPVEAGSSASIAEELLGQFRGETVGIGFPVEFPEGTSRREAFSFLRSQGLLRVWDKETLVRTDEEAADDVLTDRLLVALQLLRVEEREKSRLAQGIEEAMRLGKGQVAIRTARDQSRIYTDRRLCSGCGREFPAPAPALFSFNNPQGACPTCHGFGRVVELDWNRVVPEPGRSVRSGAIQPFRSGSLSWWQRMLEKTCLRRGISIDTPFFQLSPAEREFILEGERSKLEAEEAVEAGRWCGLRGFFSILEKKAYKTHVRVFLSRYRNYRACPDCGGARFTELARAYRLPLPSGDLSIAEFCALPAQQARRRLASLVLPPTDPATRRAWEEVLVRLHYLEEIGLGYLSLDRPTRSLSGGEIRRANLTICLGNQLSNTLFVLDEPTIGLHPRDVDRLLAVMRRLRDQGNTVVAVEHDERVIEGADHLVELGPGRGAEGGEVVFCGSPAEILRSPRSLTGAYLSGRKRVPVRASPRPIDSVPRLRLSHIRVHNLEDLALDLPLHRFVAVTGVSGSGKSSLVHDALAATLRSALSQPDKPSPFRGEVAVLIGWEGISALYEVDQSPLSRTPRSNLALYIKAWEPIRKLFAQTEDALSRGLTARSFSLNAGDGRCPHCEGSGVERVQMQFLADVFLPCPICQGKRFQPHVLAVRLGGKSLEELLAMSVTEAVGFLWPKEGTPSSEERLRRQAVRRLGGLSEIGLGYLRLGHPLSQLSGGESQRLKVWNHLSGGIRAAGEADCGRSEGSGAALFLVDEPTTGLHADDIPALLRLFQRIVDQGNTLIVVEHNLEVIRSADWVIELGPEGGADGGRVVVAGDPEAIASHPSSHTGRFLRHRLGVETQNAVPLEEGTPGEPPAPPLLPDRLSIQNAHHHNLKSLSLDITLGSFTVLTGVSGSGKSTLAFDILFTEGQRRYLDCLSGYARQFVEQMEKPTVEAVTGLPPTVAIEQRLTRPGSKSTVATIAEIFPFLRLLYARLGIPADPATGEPAQRQSLNALLSEVLRRLVVPQRLLAPVVRGRKGNYVALGRWAARKKVSGLRIDGRWVDPQRFSGTHRYRTHSIDVWLGTLLPGSTEAEVERMVAEALSLGRETILLLDPQGKESLLSTRYFCPGSGRAFEELDPRLFSFHSPLGWCPDCQGQGSPSDRVDEGSGAAIPCPSCRGTRLNPVAAAVRLPFLRGEEIEAGPTLPEICRLSVEEAIAYFSQIPIAGREAPVLAKIFPEVLTRLRFLEQAGLGYLALDRPAPTLSAGETQRIHLAAQLGSNLQGVLYVLDEPTIGLHAQENARLLDTLDELRAKGNTLVVVEHDEETIRRADRVIDLGPGAGRFGGQIVADGPWTSFAGDPSSATGRLLGSPLRHPLRGRRRPCGPSEPWLRIKGIEVHNLHDLSLALPLSKLVVLCGVSGSGKSTLLHRVLYPAACRSAAKRRSEGTRPFRPCWSAVSGADALSAAVLVDQSPIGKTSRSTPATYLGVFDQIRALFASLPTSRERGYGPGRFSYNTPSGRCPTCQGNGTLAVELPLLPLFRIPCETCSGKRYNPQTLEIEYREKTIAEILEMTVEEAASFFSGVPRLHQALELVTEAGLGYLTLGQPSPTLSGGEAQRLKLAAELAASLVRSLPRSLTPVPARHCLYLLEEPTIGLHLADVERLLRLCQRLVDLGHTVVVVEHHLDVIAEADYAIELGPGAAESGGKIVAEGAPEKIARVRKSPTAPFLGPVLKRAGHSG